MPQNQNPLPPLKDKATRRLMDAIVPKSKRAAVIGDGSIPAHVAIVMDGNGRWAQRRGLSRGLGHRQGLLALRTAVRHAQLRNISYLTVFAFSKENWSRPSAEIEQILSLARRFFHSDLDELHRSNIRMRVIGARDGLDANLIEMIERAETLTRRNDGMTLTIAVNYGGRDDVRRAVLNLARAVIDGHLRPEDICVETISAYLDTADLPDPDLVIRTSGEQRLSNFLLWQSAYAELYFTAELWPDFDAAAFDKALAAYALRERRFGGVAHAQSA